MPDGKDLKVEDATYIRHDWRNVLDNLVHKGEPGYMVVRHGQPAAMLISIDLFLALTDGKLSEVDLKMYQKEAGLTGAFEYQAKGRK